MKTALVVFGLCIGALILGCGPQNQPAATEDSKSTNAEAAPAADKALGDKAHEKRKEAIRLNLQLLCEDGNANSCVELAELWSKGEGGPADEAKAAEFMKKACDLGDQRGCETSATAPETTGE